MKKIILLVCIVAPSALKAQTWTTAQLSVRMRELYAWRASDSTAMVAVLAVNKAQADSITILRNRLNAFVPATLKVYVKPQLMALIDSTKIIIK